MSEQAAPYLASALVYGCKKRTVHARLSYFDADGNEFHVRSAVSGPLNGRSCQWQPGMGKDLTCRHAERIACGPEDRGGCVTISRKPCGECVKWMEWCGVTWVVQVAPVDPPDLDAKRDNRLLEALTKDVFGMNWDVAFINDEALRERVTAILATAQDALQSSLDARKRHD